MYRPPVVLRSSVRGHKFAINFPYTSLQIYLVRRRSRLSDVAINVMRRSALHIFRLIGASASIRHITSLNSLEQVFGHIKDEFFKGVVWPNFEAFKKDIDAYVVHWNTRRRQVKLKGLTPEEFRNQSLFAA